MEGGDQLEEGADSGRHVWSLQARRGGGGVRGRSRAVDRGGGGTRMQVVGGGCRPWRGVSSGRMGQWGERVEQWEESRQ